jgi:hypothetical protein
MQIHSCRSNLSKLGIGVTMSPNNMLLILSEIRLWAYARETLKMIPLRNEFKQKRLGVCFVDSEQDTTVKRCSYLF